MEPSLVIAPLSQAFIKCRGVFLSANNFHFTFRFFSSQRVCMKPLRRAPALPFNSLVPLPQLGHWRACFQGFHWRLAELLSRSNTNRGSDELRYVPVFPKREQNEKATDGRHGVNSTEGAGNFVTIQHKYWNPFRTLFSTLPNPNTDCRRKRLTSPAEILRLPIRRFGFSPFFNDPTVGRCSVFVHSTSLQTVYLPTQRAIVGPEPGRSP